MEPIIANTPQLEAQLEAQESERSKSQRDVRNVDRTVKDLQQQIERREKANAALEDDIGRSRDKIEKLLKAIDELQASDSSNQLQARRAERELREEKEKALRLERELGAWKALRMEKGATISGGTIRRSGQWSRGRGTSGEWGDENSSVLGAEDGIVMSKRKGSQSRQTSLSKGFL